MIEAAQSTGTINAGIGGTILPGAADVDAEGLAARIEWRQAARRCRVIEGEHEPLPRNRRNAPLLH